MKTAAAAVTASTMLALALGPLLPAAADAPAHDRSARPKVSVTVPTQLVEGDRFNVLVKVGHAAKAKQLILQQLVTDAFGHSSWDNVKKAKVRGKAKHTFHAVAGTGDAQRYRARVVYADSKPVRSQSAAATVWHWTDLVGFKAYSYTRGVSASPYNQFLLNGTEYSAGFYTSGTFATWELKFTPGRHCKAFRGVAGVTDSSQDGSAGAIQLVADDTTTVFRSGTLTPGMAQPFQVNLATPYRLAIEAQRTTPPPGKAAAYPAIGNPELLCTGLG